LKMLYVPSLNLYNHIPVNGGHRKMRRISLFLKLSNKNKQFAWFCKL
jgi:hypothetical protein